MLKNPRPRELIRVGKWLKVTVRVFDGASSITTSGGLTNAEMPLLFETKRGSGNVFFNYFKKKYSF